MRKKSNFPERSRGLFFTLGLVIAMTSAFLALTAEFKAPQFADLNVEAQDDNSLVIPITSYTAEKPKVNPKPKERPLVIPVPIDPFKPIKIIDDGGDETLAFLQDSLEVIAPITPEVVTPIPDGLLDRRPVFAGCDIGAEESERFKCFQEMLYRRISRCITFKRNNTFETHQKIWVQFVIDQEGKVSKVTFPRDGDPFYTQQLEECLISMPKFTPGFKDHKYVPTSFTVPVKISLQ